MPCLGKDTHLQSQTQGARSELDPRETQSHIESGNLHSFLSRRPQLVSVLLDALEHPLDCSLPLASSHDNQSVEPLS